MLPSGLPVYPQIVTGKTEYQGQGREYQHLVDLQVKKLLRDGQTSQRLRQKGKGLLAQRKVLRHQKRCDPLVQKIRYRRDQSKHYRLFLPAPDQQKKQRHQHQQSRGLYQKRHAQKQRSPAILFPDQEAGSQQHKEQSIDIHLPLAQCRQQHDGAQKKQRLGPSSLCPLSPESREQTIHRPQVQQQRDTHQKFIPFLVEKNRQIQTRRLIQKIERGQPQSRDAVDEEGIVGWRPEGGIGVFRKAGQISPADALQQIVSPACDGLAVVMSVKKEIQRAENNRHSQQNPPRAIFRCLRVFRHSDRIFPFFHLHTAPPTVISKSPPPECSPIPSSRT